MKKKEQKKKTKLPSLKNKWLFLSLFVISGLSLFLPAIFHLDLKSFTSLGILGVGVFNFLASATLFFPAPGIAATVVGGTLYNPILVALASSIGSTLGEGVAYTFGYSTKKISHPMSHGIFESVYKLLHHKHGMLLIIVFAFIPNPFFDVIGIVAGLALLPPKKFLLLVFIGRFARDIIVAVAASIIA